MKIAIDWDSRQRAFLLTGAFSQPVRFTSSFHVTQQGAPQRGRTIDEALGTPVRQRGRGRDAWTFERGGVRLTLAWEAPAAGAVILHTRLENASPAPIHLHQLTPARFDDSLPYFADLDAVRVYRNGFQSWSPSGSVPGRAVQEYPRLDLLAPLSHHVDAPDWGRTDGLLSFLFTILSQHEQRATLLGFLGQRAGLGTLFFQNGAPRTLGCVLDYGGKRLGPGQSVSGEPLVLYRGEADAVLERYTRAMAAAMDARPPETSPVGWCSWYELYTSVSEVDMRANARALAAHPELGVEYVQLDDGYQTAVGDWLSLNRKFPGGLAALAADIRGRGFRAGIWTAPFFAGKRSRLLREHPGWFLADERDEPLQAAFHLGWKTRLYALDLSHPAVEAWLHDTFATLARWGFDYFKVDFLFAGIRTGKRFDPGLSPVEAYRRGLGAIRAAIGPDRYLLGCGAPIGPSIGLVDGMRVSADVKEVWHEPLLAALARGTDIPSLRDSLRNNMTRAFMHRAWWVNDPDCLLVRDRRTELTRDEIHLMVTILGMTGGAVFLSDDLASVELARLDLATAILPPTSLHGHPVDLMERELPETFVLAQGERRLLALVNPTSTPRRRIPDVDPRRELCFDFWAERVLADPPCTVPAHGVRALLITPRAAEPAVVGTTLHLTALVDGRITSSYDPATCQLVIAGHKLARRRGELWLALPEGFTAAPERAWQAREAADSRKSPDSRDSLHSWDPRDSGEPMIKRVTRWEHGLILEVKVEGAWRLVIPCQPAA
jgi:alpha-galactosidase